MLRLYYRLGRRVMPHEIEREVAIQELTPWVWFDLMLTSSKTKALSFAVRRMKTHGIEPALHARIPEIWRSLTEEAFEHFCRRLESVLSPKAYQEFATALGPSNIGERETETSMALVEFGAPMRFGQHAVIKSDLTTRAALTASSFDDVLDHPENSLLKVAGEPPLTQLEEFAKSFGRLNGQDRRYLAGRCGVEFARAQLFHGLSKPRADTVARSFVRAAHLFRMDEESLFSLYFIKSRARELHSATAAMPEEKLAAELLNLADIQQQANRVRREASKCPGLFSITVATSQFHEDRLIATILKAALDRAHGPAVRPLVRNWGSLCPNEGEEADIGILNSGASSDEYYRLTEPLYMFNGCYAFARYEWLESLRASDAGELPPAVVELLPSLLRNNGMPANISSEQELAARSWIGLRGGLFRNERNGFAELEKPIRDHAAMLRNPPPTSICGENEPLSMDAEFALFVQGKVKVFMGGALHARLIQRWWSDPNVGRVFVELLNPKILERIEMPGWPMRNCLAFSHGCFGRANASARDKLAIAIEDLYRHIGKLLHKLALQANPEALPIFEHLVSRLVTNELKDPQAEWSFVTEEQDLQTLLRYDNEAWLPCVSP